MINYRTQEAHRWDGPTSSESRSAFQRLDANFHFYVLPAAAQSKTFYRRYVAIVAAPRQGNVRIGSHHIVGGIETQPAVFGSNTDTQAWEAAVPSNWLPVQM